MKRNFVYSPQMVFVAMVLFFAGCNSKSEDPNSASADKPKIVIQKEIGGEDCGWYDSPKEVTYQNSAIIFTDQAHHNFRLDSTKINTAGNSSYVPLNLTLDYGDNEYRYYNFVDEQPEFVLTVKSKVEKLAGRKIKRWDYSDIKLNEHGTGRQILFGMWIDYEDNETFAQPQIPTKGYKVRMKRGGSLYKTFNMPDSVSLSFARQNNWPFNYKNNKLHVIVPEMSEFMLSCQLIKK